MVGSLLKINAVLLSILLLAVPEADAAPRKKLNLKRLAPMGNTAPALSRSAWVEEESALNQTSLDDLYTPEITKSVEGRYKAVESMEQKTTGAHGRARPWEVEQYNKSKEEVAAWTAKEVLSNRLKTILRGADKSSGGMKALTTMKTLMGGDDEPAVSEKSKQGASGKSGAPAILAKKEEPKIPTRVKTRMNVVKGQGEVRFSNPIVITSLNLDANKKADNNVAVRMEKELSALDLKSNVDYGLEKKVVSVNVSKKITEEITANVISRHATSGGEVGAGKKSEEAVNMLYSISF